MHSALGSWPPTLVGAYIPKVGYGLDMTSTNVDAGNELGHPQDGSLTRLGDPGKLGQMVGA